MGQNRASAAVGGDQGEQWGCEHGFQAGCVNLLLTEPGCSLGAGAGEQGTRGKAPREGPPDAGTQARPRVFALPVSVLTRRRAPAVPQPRIQLTMLKFRRYLTM